MSFGLLGLNQQMQQQAMQGKGQVAQLEQQRNHMNQQIETAGHQRNMNSAGIGAGIGMSVGGPVGAAIGGGAGYLISSIFG